MAKTTSMYFRIDPQIKSSVENIYSRYGMSITDAINVFLYQSINIGGLPFDLRPAEVPNAKTVRAIKSGKKLASGGKGRFRDADALLRSLKH